MVGFKSLLSNLKSLEEESVRPGIVTLEQATTAREEKREVCTGRKQRVEQQRLNNNTRLDGESCGKI